MKFLSFVAIALLISSVLANYKEKFDDEKLNWQNIADEMNSDRANVRAHKKKSEDEIINLRVIAAEVNSDPTSLWKADTYSFDEISVGEIKKKLGAKLAKDRQSRSMNLSKSKLAAQNKTKLGFDWGLPVSYDVRQRYPYCRSVSHIRDQSYCGSCWAVSAASVLSDRYCIRSKGRYNIELSSRFVLSCDEENYGCNGGYLDLTWEFLEKNGTITGGEFQSDEGCQPYPMHPCGWPRKLPCPLYLTPKCLKNKCENEFLDYTHEKYPVKARESYHVGDDLGLFNEFYIRNEIFRNGPVQAGFSVYADFLAYKSGIYYHRKYTKYLGGHAIKIIGWGQEKGVKYWIISNSWGESWGENGTFRMIRGKNNCGIENNVYAGIPQF